MAMKRELLLSTALVALLAACGDDVTRNTNVSNVTGAKTVADLDAAGICDSTSLGEIVLNAEDGALYVCNGRKWLTMKGEPGEQGDPGSPGAPGEPGAPGDSGAAGQSCTGRTIAEGLEISCGGVVLDTLMDGSDGAPGDSGAAGQSCTAAKFNDGLDSGVVVSCGGAVVDTIRNGHDGAPGAPGDSGAAGRSCTGRTIAEGLEISCGGVVLDTLTDGADGVGCTSEAIKDEEGATRAVVVTCGARIDTLLSAGYALCGNVAYVLSLPRVCDMRDGQLYKTVDIGSRTWMAENLNFDYKVAGESYGSYCYNDEPDSCAKYGRLYTWAAAMDTATTGCGYGKTCAASGRMQGACPDGWRLPDADDWNALFDAAAGGPIGAGTALKTATGWYDGDEYYVPGTNSSGFSALPSGYRYEDWEHFFLSAGQEAMFWVFSERDESHAEYMGLNYGNANAGLGIDYKSYGFAVRCLRN